MSLVPSCAAPRMLRPSESPIWGSLLAPKMSRTMSRMMSSSPMPGMTKLLRRLRPIYHRIRIAHTA